MFEAIGVSALDKDEAENTSQTVSAFIYENGGEMSASFMLICLIASLIPKRFIEWQELKKKQNEEKKKQDMLPK